MKVYRSLDEIDHGFGPCALTIGNFDGVHAGHRRILRRVAALARERGWKASAMTFHPHPLKIVAPERAPKLLSTPEERIAIMAEEGIGQVLILPFTPELMRMSPEEFAQSVVCNRLEAKAVLVGGNFRFGHRHAGDTAMLAEFGRRCGFAVEAVPPVTVRGRIVSSSEIRRVVGAGRVALAARLLERPFVLSGSVVKGRGVGSKQTVPTLNLEPETEVLPATGVYATRTLDADGTRCWDSITNVGYRPTFDDASGLTIETYLMDPLEGAAPQRIRVAFLTRLREERKFANPDDLKVQILKDVMRAKRFFRRIEGKV
ncbi:MAG TPA: bifunctional riboflavin kinase/FAD synthetase [Bryobacteraceae bacterium]|nr:bifunctional riboflavin kinase/FAD synthetase [Bryobacteraceae bacterium]